MGGVATATDTNTGTSPGKIPGGIETPVPSDRETVPPSAGLMGLAMILGEGRGVVAGDCDGVGAGGGDGMMADGYGVLVTIAVLLVIATAEVSWSAKVVEVVVSCAELLEVVVVGELVNGNGVLVTAGVLLVIATVEVSSYADVVDVVIPSAEVLEVVVVGELVNANGVLVTVGVLLVVYIAVVSLSTGVVEVVAACVVVEVVAACVVVEVVAACVVVSFTASIMGTKMGITGAAALTSSTVKFEVSPRVDILLSSLSTADKVVSVCAARGARVTAEVEIWLYFEHPASLHAAMRARKVVLGVRPANVYNPVVKSDVKVTCVQAVKADVALEY